MLGLASCLGRKPKMTVLAKESTNYEPSADQLCSKTPEGFGSTVSKQPQIQQENPDLRAKVIELLLKHLQTGDVGKVVVYGQSGIGKTWIAKEVTKQAMSKNHFDVAIWVYKMQIHNSSVFHHISVQQNLVGADCDYHVDYEGAERSSLIQSLQQKLKGRKCLVVFDDVDDANDDNPEIDANYPMHELETVLTHADKSSKVLITTPKINDMIMTCSNTNGSSEAVEIKPLTLSESKDLLQRSWKRDQIQFLQEDDVEDIVMICKCLPSAIVFTGNLLLYALENAPNEVCRRLVIREAKKEFDDYWMLGCCSGFEKFKNNGTILRCLWLSFKYLEGHRSMNYNKLILFWMLDGYFDNTTSSLDNAYACGHKVLMDFLDAGILGQREVGDIVLERAGFKFVNYLFQTTRDKFCWEKLCNFYDLSTSGNVTRMHGSIGVFTKPDEGNMKKINLVTLLLMGSSTSKVDQVKIDNPQVAESMRILFASRVNPITNLQHVCRFILVVILKDCHSISRSNISDIANLKHLRVLEISGCSSLKKIPEDFFANFDHLESLNLSGIPIKYFPRLSFGLNNLRSLFLRCCTQLESIPDVNGLGELEVLDLSGSKFNSSEKKVCYLEGLPELRVLDLSETNIDECLNLNELNKLSLLLVKNCLMLTKLESVTALKHLEVIEATGSCKLDYFCQLNEHCLIHKLDLSNTKLCRLPHLTNAGNLVYLSLKGCLQLKELPAIEGAKNLRILDISGAILLEEINTSFHEMKSLQELLLSNTNIKALPTLSGLDSLRRLTLEGCKSLVSLPELDSLANLILVDIRGCISMKPVLGEQFGRITILKS